MIDYWLISGDTHGEFDRFDKIQAMIPSNETWGVIVLGDFGTNYYLSRGNKDTRVKKKLLERYPNIKFFAVRGNHEQRPELVRGMKLVEDRDVVGKVYQEPEFPNISYLIDGATYIINGKKTLVLGGAYSVDKEWRLEAGYGWFPREQLDNNERTTILNNVKGKYFDRVLSHTCPIDWTPTEVFLSFIDQSKVDKTMEHWLAEVRDSITFGHWWFGHYHTNRPINDKATILFEDVVEFK